MNAKVQRLVVLFCGFMSVKEMPSAAAPREKIDISYNEDQKLDLYLPEIGGLSLKRSPRPLLIYFHGGAWQGGDKSTFQKMGRAFARRGWAVAIANYTLARDGTSETFPKFMEDSAGVLAWLCAHAAENSLDAKKFVLMGHSAGAQIASLLVLDPQYLRQAEIAGDFQPAAVIGLEGIYDIPGLVKRRPDYRLAFIDKTFGPSPLRWSEASPLNHSRQKNGQAWLLLHSPLDQDVDLAQTNNFVSQLRALSSNVEVFTAFSMGHFRVVENLGDEKDPITQRIIEFLKSKNLAP